jgi:shikimate dehydrogenase
MLDSLSSIALFVRVADTRSFSTSARQLGISVPAASKGFARLDARLGVRLLNRTRARAEALAEDLGGAVTVLDWDQRHTALEGAALLANSTTQGMHGQPPLEIDLSALPRTAVVTDLVYVPLETPLLRRGTADGIGKANQRPKQRRAVENTPRQHEGTLPG